MGSIEISIGITVEDLTEATRFYSRLFELAPSKALGNRVDWILEGTACRIFIDRGFILPGGELETVTSDPDSSSTVIFSVRRGG